MPPRRHVFANRYELGDEIGHGGMADVYLAHDRLLDRRVAVKVLSPAFATDPTFVERFRREAQAAAEPQPPEHRRGLRLGPGGRHLLHRHGVRRRADAARRAPRVRARSPPIEAARIAAEIADALVVRAPQRRRAPRREARQRAHHAAGRGEGHRLRHRARRERATTLTKTGAVMGTATYFSPEQAQGLALDGRSDVYSLGVVLYEMLTGVAPFTADSPVSVAYKHVREEPVPPSRVEPDIPGAMDRIVLTAMAKDVDARYQSAAGPPRRPAALRARPPARRRPDAAPPAAAAVRAAAPVAAAPPSPTRAAPRRAAPRKRRRGAPVVAVGIALGAARRADRGPPRAVRLRRRRRRPRPTLDVPRSSASPTRQAEADARKASGFKVARADDDEPTQAPDTVLGQDPEAGRKLAQGRHHHAHGEQRHHRRCPTSSARPRREATAILAADATSRPTSSKRTRRPAAGHRARAPIPPPAARWPKLPRASCPIGRRSSSRRSRRSRCPT